MARRWGSGQPFDPRRPFPRWHGLRAGVPQRTLDGPRFRRILHGVLVDASVPDSVRLRAEAALVCFFDDAFVSHATAARLWQVPVRLPPGEHVTVSEVGHRLRRRGVEAHVRPGAQPVRLHGLKASSLVDLFVELADLLTLVDLVVAGDWMVRRHGVRITDLRRAAADVPGRHGDLARRAAALVRRRVDSPMETRLRLLFVLAGLPEPEVNLEIRTEEGDLLRRYDLSWPGVRIIVEYDGRLHVERIDQWESDLKRREAIDDSEWRILVVVADGIYRHPDETLARVHRVLLRRGLPGVPRRLKDDWRPHFPGWDHAA